MRTSSTSIFSEFTGEQLLLLAIANAGLRPTVSRVLNSRARANRPRSSAAAQRSDASQPQLVLRRAG